MYDFWEEKFKREKIMWGLEPSDSAILTKDLFIKHKISNILIPGFGYGRNAQIFIDNNISITGIEISKSAIEISKKEISKDIHIHCGSVTEMPFDTKVYDGIFCYALIHLLNRTERKQFLKNCYNQLKKSGFMVFTVVSKEANMFGNGKKLSQNRYELLKGLKVFFYDEISIKKEFENFGLKSFEIIEEPIKHIEKEPPLKCYFIKCYKN